MRAPTGGWEQLQRGVAVSVPTSWEALLGPDEPDPRGVSWWSTRFELPAAVVAATRALKGAFPDTPLELHLHDDRGLALANGLSGIEAGADWIAATINGIGERCGIVDTLQLLVNLRLEGRLPAAPDGQALVAARDLVAAATGLPVGPQRAVTGAYAFTHTSRLHRQAMARDEAAYEAIDPGWLDAHPTEDP